MSLPDTPVMQQYGRLKGAHPGFLLWFRMGDFYELFGDDAEAAAGVLQITLTKRRTSREGDEGIPMCGVPYHAAEGYIAKCLKAGFKVALAEQVETPEEAKKARGSSALVERKVVRLYTPGTLTEDALLEATRPTYLAAVAAEDTSAHWRGVLAWLDLSTGEVGHRPVQAATLGAAVAALAPGEIVVPPALEGAVEGLLSRRQVSVQEGLFSPLRAEETVCRAYGLKTVEGLSLTGAAVAAVGALLGYAELTQMGKLPALKHPRQVAARSVLEIDPATRRNLELTESLAGNRKDSLLHEIDRTVTAAGGRLLSRWLAEPSSDVAVIAARQDAVEALVNNPDARAEIRALLKQTGDVARCVSRLLLERGGPRDVAVLRQTGAQLPALAKALAKLDGRLLGQHRDGLSGLAELTAYLARALADDPLPALMREGGFVRDGFDAELDNQRHMVTHGQELLAALETEENAVAGGTFKLRYNKVWGYYFEVGKAQEGKVPAHFIHRQSTTTAHRYTTEKLMTLERQLGSAAAQAQAREEAVFAEMCAAVRKASLPLLAASEALATVDVLAALAELAARGGWVRPVVDDSRTFEVEGGKHPVVAARVGTFVANGCDLSDGQLWLLTGPNMAGKSTYLRQNALLLVLAQMGSFVPATRARIGVADALFSRIGAADNLAAGQSTFMVEMVETAQILNRATARSFVILDELGRGTATYDGLAIAWACVEHIAQELGCRTLFATHYHELNGLAGTLEQVSTHHVAVKEWKGEIVFLHEVRAGAASGSYGVHVAKLAGLPPAVVARADGLLAGFTKAARGKGAVGVDELALFATPAHYGTEKPETELERRVKALDVDGMSARDALDEVYRLRDLVH
ncbi:MAG: DNA mismatch repair protein MutS [Pseudomonadaceae bacterium]|nr:DNA mismatch repair protein MutS [Pseudomonadaceae bacterium]